MAEASTLETLSPKELGKHLREVRRRKGLSLSEVARGAGLTRRELNAYEKGKSPIPDSDLFVLAGSCGVDVAELRVPTTAAELGAAHEVGNALVPANGPQPVASTIGDVVAQLRRGQEVVPPPVPAESRRRRRPRAIATAPEPVVEATPAPWPDQVDSYEAVHWPDDASIPSPSASETRGPAEPVDVFEELARLPDPEPLPASTTAGPDFFGRMADPETPPFVTDDAPAAPPFVEWPAFEADNDADADALTFDESDGEPVLVEMPQDAGPDLTTAADAPPINVEMRGESSISPWDALRGSDRTLDRGRVRVGVRNARRLELLATEPGRGGDRRRRRYLGARQRRGQREHGSGSRKCRRRQRPTPTRVRSTWAWTTTGSPKHRSPSTPTTHRATKPSSRASRSKRSTPRRKPRSPTSSTRASPARPRRVRPVRGPTSPTPTPPAPASTSTGATPTTPKPTSRSERRRGIGLGPARGRRRVGDAARARIRDRDRAGDRHRAHRRAVDDRCRVASGRGRKPTTERIRCTKRRTTTTPTSSDEAASEPETDGAAGDRSVRPDRRRAHRRVRALPARALRTRAHRSFHRTRAVRVDRARAHRRVRALPTRALRARAHRSLHRTGARRLVRAGRAGGAVRVARARAHRRVRAVPARALRTRARARRRPRHTRARRRVRAGRAGGAVRDRALRERLRHRRRRRAALDQLAPSARHRARRADRTAGAGRRAGPGRVDPQPAAVRGAHTRTGARARARPGARAERHRSRSSSPAPSGYSATPSRSSRCGAPAAS